MIGLAVAVALMGMSTLLFAITRRNAVHRTFVTSRRKAESSLDLAWALACLQRSRVVAGATVCAAAVAVIAQLDVELAERFAWSATPAILLALALAALLRLHRVLAIRRDAGVVVLAHGDFLYLTRDGALVAWIAAPPWRVARVDLVPRARVL